MRTILLLALLSSCGVLKESANKLCKGKGCAESTKPGPNPNPDVANFSLSMTLERYAHCEELQGLVRNQLIAYQNEQKQMHEQARSRPSSSSKGNVAADSQTSSSGQGSVTYVPGVANESATSAAKSESFTNVQEKGVDEADRVKIGTTNIFVASSDSFIQVDRASLDVIGAISLADLTNTSAYVMGDTLSVVGQTKPKACSATPNVSCSYTPPSTVVRIFKAGKGTLATTVGEKTFPWQLVDSRLLGKHLYLVFSSQLPIIQPVGQPEPYSYPEIAYDLSSRPAVGYSRGYRGNGYGSYSYPDHQQHWPEIPSAPVKIDTAGTVDGIPCDAIVKQFLPDLDFQLNVVAAVDVESIETPTKLTANVGGGQVIYMTQESLYITKHGANWSPFGTPRTADFYDSTVIAKVRVSTAGDLAFVAVGGVRGRIKDQWALKEFAAKRALAVATTTWGSFDSGESEVGARQSNHLWALSEEEGKLVLKNSVKNFGLNEDIRAIRYVEDIAYVVTYQKTDPLYAISMKDPLAPTMLSELKIPGFSMYLHPLGNGRLLGIGYDADEKGSFSLFQGIQISLFDTSNPNVLSRLDNHVHGTRGSYSDVTGDHKAFYFDAETKTIGVPLVELDGGSSNETGGGASMGHKVAFSGAVLYRLEDTRLIESGRVTHNDLIAAECRSQMRQGSWWQNQVRSIDVNRLYTVDSRLLSVSRFGIKAHDRLNPSAVTKTTSFPQLQVDCSMQ